MVLVKQSPGTARGMVFVTLEDETGFINLAFTPQVYARFYRAVDQQAFSGEWSDACSGCTNRTPSW